MCVEGELAVDVFVIKTCTLDSVSARDECGLNTGRFHTKRGKNLGLIQGVRLMYLSLIQVTFFSRITNKSME